MPFESMKCYTSRPTGGSIRLLIIAGMAAAGFAAAPARARGEASFTGLGELAGGSFFSQALAVSADGSTVVGQSDPGGGDHEAFRWTRSGGMQALGGVSAIPASRALGASADGSVVVGLSGTQFAMEAFRWTAAGGMQALPRLAPENITNVAWGVSGDGSVVVGQSNSATTRHAFRWDAATGTRALPGLGGEIIDLIAVGVSGDGSTVLGQRQSSRGWREAVVWAADGTVRGIDGFDPEGHGTDAAAISADGTTVVGTAGVNLGNDDTSIAFRWTSAGGIESLDDLPGSGFHSMGRAVNGDGSVVVGVGRAEGGDEAFLWTPGSRMRSLRDVLVTDHGLDLAGWTLKEATGISADGRTIAGWGLNPAGQTEAWVAVVPEPSLLGGVAVVGTMLFLRRRKPSGWHIRFVSP